jgi:phosphoglycerate dehydrogenase-like enzyme
MNRPRILVAIRPALYNDLFAGDADASLRKIADLVPYEGEKEPSPQWLAENIWGSDAVITGWGTPAFDDKVLAAAENLKLIAHSAGTVKHMLPEAVFRKGIAVTHSAAAIAKAVAEASLLAAKLGLNPIHRHDAFLKAGGKWHDPKVPVGREISGLRVGVISASYVGRYFMDLLRPLGCEIWLYDPMVDETQAKALGAVKKDLDSVMSGCEVVSVHAPVIPETKNLITGKHLAMLKDGAVFVNTARSWIVDQDAMLEELKKGRFTAALDVFDKEPLAIDSPLRKLDNVILTPHTAGATKQSKYRQGMYIAEEVGRFFSGKPLLYAVTLEKLATMA